MIVQLRVLWAMVCVSDDLRAAVGRSLTIVFFSLGSSR